MVKITSIKANPVPFKTIYHHSIHRNDKKSSFQDLLSRPLIQSIKQRVKELNSKYYLPTNKQTKIVSEPVRALRDKP